MVSPSVDGPVGWLQGNLRIARSALDAIERAGVAAYARDEEACGYLSGPASDPLFCDAACELENLANKYHAADPVAHPRTGHDYFKVNSRKFERAIDEGSARARPLKVFFHSHLDCGAYFSQEDADSMTGGGAAEPAYALCYLVTAVDKGAVSGHKLFVWDGATRSFVESDFSVA